MRELRMLALAAALATPCGVSAQSLSPETLASSVDAKVVEWRRDIHQHPELSNREFRTAKKVEEHLRALGLEPQTGIAHTGVVALLKGGRPGPRILLRADMDALPVTERSELPFASKATGEYRGETVGVMHACGHDAHTAILMGVAEALAGVREQLPGEVLFVFQPAEEGAPAPEDGGASLMLKEGLFTTYRPEMAFGLHVWANLHVGDIGYRSGPMMAASDSFEITVHGRQTHGSRPWGGIDPVVAASAIVLDAQHIVARRQDITRQPVVLTFGSIDGGVRHNIIPDSVELLGTIRTFDEGMRDATFAQLKGVAEHVAAAHGATVDARIPSVEGNPVTANDPQLAARMAPLLENVPGVRSVREMGLITGAEDFSYFAREVPAFYFFVGATPRGRDLATVPNNHSPEFFLDEEALRVGTRAMLAVALEALSGPR